MKQLCLCLAGFALLMLAACGGDDSSSKKRGTEAGSGGGTDAGSTSSTDKTLKCGAKTCRLPGDSIYEPCCRDEFASECGTLVGMDCRRERAEVDKRCPLPDLPGLADAGSTTVSGVSACCTPSNQCGLDLGLGAGCQSNVGGCELFPAELRSKLAFTTCDGDPIDVPEDCMGSSDTP